jgi:hypothetical protein
MIASSAVEFAALDLFFDTYSSPQEPDFSILCIERAFAISERYPF